MSEEKSANTLRHYSVALAVAVVCAIGVSMASVILRPYYLANQDAARLGRLQSMLDALAEANFDVSSDRLRAITVALDTGVVDASINPAIYDAKGAVLKPKSSLAIPANKDHAGMNRRENHAVVYLATDQDGAVVAVILPVWGVGYQSAIYGYLALANNVSEILAFRIYEHGETPGLGSRIQDKSWEQLWPGNQAFNDSGAISIHVGGDSSTDRIDAISGATRTSMGINGMLKFWLGDLGFGRFLDNYRQQRIEL